MKYATQMSCIVVRMTIRDPLEFRTEETAIASVSVVSLLGELDIQHESHVTAGFERALDRHPAVLAADLRGLSFMDSTGVHALLAAERRSRTQGTRFLVIRGSVAVDRVLSVLGLDRLFEIIAGPEHLPGDSAVLEAAR
jgi:anti-sigma B factor antagonist